MSIFIIAFSSCAGWAADLDALRRAVSDLTAAFPDAYKDGSAYLDKIDGYQKKLSTQGADSALVSDIAAFHREALLANPLLSSFEKVLVIKRNAEDPSLGLPQNWQGNCSLPLTKYDNEIATFAPRKPDGPLMTLFKPDKSYFVGDVDLHFDGDRLLFSMPGTHGRCQIWEIHADGSGLRQVTPGDEEDVDNYDACYLPDGRIIYASTANYQGVPCVAGSDSVANLCIMNADGSGIRQLCFDQDHDWCPTVLNNGRILYTRWEYTDLPHSNTRLLFHMNPDGTDQSEYYKSNSYWPASVMYARPIPGHPTKVVAIVTGHHGVPRMGELVILDPAQSRHEAGGAVQRIPGYGKPVKPVVADNIVDSSWPKFLHPYPLNDKYFLVSCQPNASANWGIYLVDIFDNILLLREEPGYALFEPIPLRPTPKQPVVPDRVKLSSATFPTSRLQNATVFLADIYTGQGLAGIPRGTVKALRLISYTFAYRKTGGLLGVIGMDGPWDIKHILGTVPVEEDGSAFFQVPANTPIAVQPLDEKGRALQLMRSWFTAMPGETLSCVGCHDSQNGASPATSASATRRPPSAIEPWRGPARPFSFAREVQPVLDRYCVSCHDGVKPSLPDLRGTNNITDWKSDYPGNGGAMGGKFSVAYANLHQYVRRPGIESDYHLLTPMEFHASTTELVQMLEKGHHGVMLDPEAWDRLNVWIDLNTPFHGKWSEIVGESAIKKTAERRRELLNKYAGLDADYETIAATEIHMPSPPFSVSSIEDLVGRTVSPSYVHLQQSAGREESTVRTTNLEKGISMDLAYIPPGEFDMGDNSEGPIARVAIEEPFWLGRFEVTNEQFAQFDPRHDSGVESMHAYQFGIRGYPVNGPHQPVVRVSWDQAMEFCRWLSARTGKSFSLPTEAQWEYACRAGTTSPFFYGDLNTDFSAYANLGDVRLREFARNTYIQVNLLPNPNRYDDWIPKDDRFDDGAFLLADVGKYKPNPWGLYDMHGNAAEWTRSAYAPYPYNENDGRNDEAVKAVRVVRGGSWYDRPKRATASFRLGYAQYQPVFNVGFRVACSD